MCYVLLLLLLLLLLRLAAACCLLLLPAACCSCSQGFPMKQGVLTNGRVRLMMSPGDQVGFCCLRTAVV
jgi:hypothetical protein